MHQLFASQDWNLVKCGCFFPVRKTLDYVFDQMTDDPCALFSNGVQEFCFDTCQCFSDNDEDSRGEKRDRFADPETQWFIFAFQTCVQVLRVREIGAAGCLKKGAFPGGQCVQQSHEPGLQ
jgi:hypothetical protein